MRLLYVCPDLGIPVLGRKGASIHVRELVAAFTRQGAEVLVGAATLEGSPWEEPAALPVPVLHVPPGPETTAAVSGVRAMRDALGASTELPGDLRRILHDADLERGLLSRMRRTPPDAIYERASTFSTAAARVARTLGVPRVVELNAPLALEHRTYRAGGTGDLAELCERETLTSADRVLTVSGALAEHAESLGVDPDRIEVVPNGVDPLRFRSGAAGPAARARLGDGGPVIGFVGGLRPWHGVEALAPLLEALSLRHPDARLVIVGDGPLRDVVERDLELRGLRERAVITGAVAHDEVPDLIRAFDVAVAPYPALDHDFYFSPLKLFEYQACGVPVVAPAVGEIPGIVRDGETGLLYSPGDLDGLIGSCAALLADPALGRRLGGAGEILMRAERTWDHNARLVLERIADLREQCTGVPA